MSQCPPAQCVPSDPGCSSQPASKDVASTSPAVPFASRICARCHDGSNSSVPGSIALAVQPAMFEKIKLSRPCRALARTQSRENPRGHEKRHGEHFSLHVLRLPRTSYITSPVLGARRNVNLPPTRRVLLTCYLREAAKRAVGLRRNHGDAWRCAGLENSNPPKPPDFGQGTFDRSKNHTRKLKCSKDPSRGSCVDAPT